MNIMGLAVGIGVCMMILIIIQFHTTFDNFHSKKDRIHRVLTEYHHADAGNNKGLIQPFQGCLFPFILFIRVSPGTIQVEPGRRLNHLFTPKGFNMNSPA
jgi:hypothetical protein